MMPHCSVGGSRNVSDEAAASLPISSCHLPTHHVTLEGDFKADCPSQDRAPPAACPRIAQAEGTLRGPGTRERPPEPPPAPGSASSCPRMAQAEGTLRGPGTQESPSETPPPPRCSGMAQVPEPPKPPYDRTSASHGSPCTLGTTVVTPQPGVGQIVLNIRAQNDGVTLAPPTQGASPCTSGCPSLQKVVKQIVLIFLNQPCEAARRPCSQSCRGSVSTVSSSTQTEEGGWLQSPHCPPPKCRSHSSSPYGPAQISCSNPKTDGERLCGMPNPPSCHPNTHNTPVSPCDPYTHPMHMSSGDPNAPLSPVSSGDPNTLPSHVSPHRTPELSSPSHSTKASPVSHEGVTSVTRVRGPPVFSSYSQDSAAILNPTEEAMECENIHHPPSFMETSPLQACYGSKLSDSQTGIFQRPEASRPSPQNPELPCEELMESASYAGRPDSAWMHSMTSPHKSCQADQDRGRNEKMQHMSRPDPAPIMGPSSQAQMTDEPVPIPLRKCEHCSCSPPSNPSTLSCSTSFLSPSLNQYLDVLLEQHRTSLQDSLHPCSTPSSSSRGPCSPPQPPVRQIILNFLEQDSKPTNQEISSAACGSATTSLISGNPNIPSAGTASDEPGTSSRSETQHVSTHRPSCSGNRDLPRTVNEDSSVVTNMAADQDIPMPSRAHDLSCSEVLISKTVNEHFPDPDTCPVISNKSVHGDIPDCDVSSDTRSMILTPPVIEDIPDPDTCPVISNKSVHEDIPDPDTCPVISNKSVHEDIPDPDTCPVISNKSVHEDIPDCDVSGNTRSVILTRPLIEDIPDPDAVSDTLISNESVHYDIHDPVAIGDPCPLISEMPVDFPDPVATSDTCPLLPNRKVQHDLPDRDVVGDTSPVTPEEPVHEDIPDRDATSDACPLLPSQQVQCPVIPKETVHKDIPGPDATNDTCMLNLNQPVNRGILNLNAIGGICSLKSSKPVPEDIPDPDAGDTYALVPSKAVLEDISDPDGGDTYSLIPSKPVHHDATIDMCPLILIQPVNEDIPGAAGNTCPLPLNEAKNCGNGEDQLSSVAHDVSGPGSTIELSAPGKDASKPTNQDDPAVDYASDTCSLIASKPFHQDVTKEANAADQRPSVSAEAGGQDLPSSSSDKQENRAIPGPDPYSSILLNKEVPRDIPGPDPVSDTCSLISYENRGLPDAGNTCLIPSKSCHWPVYMESNTGELQPSEEARWGISKKDVSKDVSLPNGYASEPVDQDLSGPDAAGGTCSLISSEFVIQPAGKDGKTGDQSSPEADQGVFETDINSGFFSKGNASEPTNLSISGLDAASDTSSTPSKPTNENADNPRNAEDKLSSISTEEVLQDVSVIDVTNAAFSEGNGELASPDISELGSASHTSSTESKLANRSAAEPGNAEDNLTSILTKIDLHGVSKMDISNATFSEGNGEMASPDISGLDSASHTSSTESKLANRSAAEPGNEKNNPSSILTKVDLYGVSKMDITNATFSEGNDGEMVSPDISGLDSASHTSSRDSKLANQSAAEPGNTENKLSSISSEEALQDVSVKDVTNAAFSEGNDAEMVSPDISGLDSASHTSSTDGKLANRSAAEPGNAENKLSSISSEEVLQDVSVKDVSSAAFSEGNDGELASPDISGPDSASHTSSTDGKLANQSAEEPGNEENNPPSILTKIDLHGVSKMDVTNDLPFAKGSTDKSVNLDVSGLDAASDTCSSEASQSANRHAAQPSSVEGNLYSVSSEEVLQDVPKMDISNDFPKGSTMNRDISGLDAASDPSTSTASQPANQNAEKPRDAEAVIKDAPRSDTASDLSSGLGACTGSSPHPGMPVCDQNLHGPEKLGDSLSPMIAGTAGDSKTPKLRDTEDFFLAKEAASPEVPRPGMMSHKSSLNSSILSSAFMEGKSERRGLLSPEDLVDPPCSAAVRSSPGNRGDSTADQPGDISSNSSSSLLMSGPFIQDVYSVDLPLDTSPPLRRSPAFNREVSVPASCRHSASPLTDTVINGDVPSSRATDVSSSASGMHRHQDTQIGSKIAEKPSKEPIENGGNAPSWPHRPPKSRSCPALLTDGVMSPADEVVFEDVAVIFSEEEWAVLESGQKDLYRQVMMDNYLSLHSLGFLLDKPELISRIEKREALLGDQSAAFWSFRRGGEEPCFPGLLPGSIRSLAVKEGTSLGAASDCDRSSHLGALMRLVNEIPGFLLGGSPSPVQSLEEPETRPCSEVKTEESSLASFYSQPIRETPEICSSSPAIHRSSEKGRLPGATKLEETELSINQSNASIIHIKREPDCILDPLPPSEVKIKQEGSPVTCTPSPGSLYRKPEEISSIKSRSPLLSRSPMTGSREARSTDSERRLRLAAGDGGPWTSLPPPPSTRTSSRNTSLSPGSLSDSTSSVGAKDLHIKIKEEDSGSERDLAESPLCGRKVFSSPLTPSSGSSIMEHFRQGSSPRRSPADNIPPGSSHLHGLVNCLKEISAGRPRVYQTPPSAGRWGAEMTRIPAAPESSPRPARLLIGRGPEIPAAQPNPFTVAVTNGSSRARGMEVKTVESWRLRDSPHVGGSSVSSLGKCLDKFHTRLSGEPSAVSSNSVRSEEPQRAELGVKRAHSDDLSRLSGGRSSAKRPALDPGSPSRAAGYLSSRLHDSWKPPDEKPGTPDNDQTNGKSPLLSVMNCVRKIHGSQPSPPVRGAPTSRSAAACSSSARGANMEERIVKVEEEKNEGPPVTAQWIQPPPSPCSPDQSGSSSTNVHLSRLMKLMEEIPVVESSSSSRAMFSIAIGQSMMRLVDRGNYLSCYNHDGTFQADLNDNTIASVDSTFSDDTSLSSDNVDPSYSAIDGLHKVVSEFSEVASVSPLVALSAPPIMQEGSDLKTREPGTAGSSSHVNEAGRGSQRGKPVNAAVACSAENGEVSYAALCGLQKVVCGFKEQECVSPFSAVRGTPQHSQRESPARKCFPAAEEESPRHPDSSPSPGSRFLSDGHWLSRNVSAPTGLGNMDSSSPSPVIKPSNPPSTSNPDAMMRRGERGQNKALPLQGVHHASPRPPPASSSHCIDLTLEDEPTVPRSRAPTQDKLRISHELPGPHTPDISTNQPVKPPGGRVRPTANRQLIDLTEEEEAPVRPRAPSTEAPRRASHSASTHSGAPRHPPNPERRHRPPLTATNPKRACMERPLDPGPPRALPRGGVPSVNEHISGLEKLLKGVPTFTPPSGPKPGGSWWFKSTSPHET